MTKAAPNFYQENLGGPTKNLSMKSIIEENLKTNKRAKREISPTFGEDMTKELKVFQDISRKKNNPINYKRNLTTKNCTSFGKSGLNSSFS